MDYHTKAPANDTGYNLDVNSSLLEGARGALILLGTLAARAGGELTVKQEELEAYVASGGPLVLEWEHGPEGQSVRIRTVDLFRELDD